MEPSSGAESEQIAEDETEEVAAEQAPEDSNVKEEEAEGAPEAAMADEAEGVPVAAMTDEAEGAPVTAMAEEAEGAPVTAMEEGEEGAPVAATEEEMGVAPVAAMEEEVEGAPVAAMEEEVEGAPVTATEEEVEGVPVAAMEEEVESAPVAATEEEVEGAPVSAVEEEVEGAPVAAVEEEVEGAPVAATAEEVEGAPVAAVEEEVEGAPVAAMEEEVEGAPVAATEEEVEGAPVAATEEEVEGAPVAAMEEEVEGTPVAAKEEEEGAPVAAMEEEVEGAPLTAREEEGERAPVATKEEEGEGVPEASSEEEGEGGPMANLLERLLTERAQAGVTGEGILGEPSLSAQFGDVFPERTEREIRSEFATEEQIAISSESSETSSMKSDYATKPLRSGAARSVVFSPHPAVQLSSIGAMELDEDERELRFSERDFEEAEEETQLVVLDPEHPLMKRFQSALKAYLKKQMGKLTDDLLELTVGVKNNKKQREELGVILYGVQQQLARLQMDLEKNHNQHSQIAMARRQLEEELNDLRNTYRKTCQTAADERKKVSAMQAEMETLSLQLFYMQNMDQDVRDDIAVMKRTVKKAEAERIRAEVEKQKQDLYVDRLTRRADELQQQIALYEAQHIAQAEDSKITRQEVAEASTEIQIIHLEKKQLFHQWNVSLTGMKRRDEAYAAMQEALRESRHKLKSLEVEIEVYKKSISKEEERNELLASILNRSENDANMSRKLIVQSVSKQDAMKVEFGTYTRTLHETEQALSRINTDRAARMNDLVTLRRDIEKETESKQAMENEIMTKLQDQLMSNKAARYFLQLASNLQKKMVDLEMQFVKVENEAAQATLDITNTTCRLNVLEKILSELDKEMDAVNSQINHSEIEIAKRNLLIERKQGAINLFNKKLEVMISQLGGQELGPLEIEIRKLTKQIDDTDMELVLLQRHWLKHQKILVTLTQERDEQLESMDMQKKEITIKEQKRVRIENEIQQEKNELKDIKRHMKNMANDLEKLHILINKNSTTSEELQQGNSIMENEFVRSLKVSERESIEMQEKLDRLHEEKERLLNSLVEAEYQMMQWEKKIQIAKEMRAAVDSEVGQGEIRVMRAEIHRMQVRYSQLMKQQERMMRDMEAAVDRRENIVVRSEAQSKLNKQVLTKGDFYYKKQEMLKKIKEIHKNSEECNKIITQLEKGQKNLCNAIMEKQKQDSTIKDLGIALQKEVDQLQITKWQNLSDIVALQARLKHLYAVKEGRYNPLCRTELMIRIERQKLEERLHRIVVIIHKVQQEYPQHHSAFQKLVKILHNKLDMP